MAFLEGLPLFFPAAFLGAGAAIAFEEDFGPGFFAPGLFLLPTGRPRLPEDSLPFLPNWFSKESTLEEILVFLPLPCDASAIRFAASTRVLI